MKQTLMGRSLVFGSILAVVLTGCASAPPLTDAGAHVRRITTKQAQACKFVQTVQYDDRIFSTGKTPTVMQAIGENNLRNAVGRTDANAFVVTKDESDWFLGTISYQADAYEC